MSSLPKFVCVVALLGLAACGGTPPSTAPGATTTPGPTPVGSGLSDSPCAGIEVETTAVVPTGGRLSTTVELRWGPEAHAVLMDWQTPYSRREVTGGVLASFRRDDLSVSLDLSVVRWQIESTFTGTRHSMDVAWPRSEEIGLRFRSDAGECVEEPALVCSLSGCEIRR